TRSSAACAVHFGMASPKGVEILCLGHWKRAEAFRSDGISVVGRIEGAGTELWDRNLWRKQRVLQGVGRKRRGTGHANGGFMHGRGSEFLLYRGYLFGRNGGGNSWESHQGATRPCTDFLESDFSDGRRAQPSGLVAIPLVASVRGKFAEVGDRLYRRVSHARLRRGDADRRDAANLGWIGAQREGTLHRLFEFFGLAVDEGAGDIGAVRVDPLCGASGLLLAHRPGFRMGAD